MKEFHTKMTCRCAIAKKKKKPKNLRSVFRCKPSFWGICRSMPVLLELDFGAGATVLSQVTHATFYLFLPGLQKKKSLPRPIADFWPLRFIFSCADVTIEGKPNGQLPSKKMQVYNVKGYKQKTFPGDGRSHNSGSGPIKIEVAANTKKWM